MWECGTQDVEIYYAALMIKTMCHYCKEGQLISGAEYRTTQAGSQIRGNPMTEMTPQNSEERMDLAISGAESLIYLKKTLGFNHSIYKNQFQVDDR